MKCNYTDKDLMLYYYEELDPSMTERLESHLKKCSQCTDSLNKLKATLDTIEIKDPEIEESFWTNYRAVVHKKIRERKSQNKTVLLRPRFIQSITAALLMLVIVFGGVRLYENRRQEIFIIENYELMMNIEMFEDYEMLQYLEEFEAV